MRSWLSHCFVVGCSGNSLTPNWVGDIPDATTIGCFRARLMERGLWGVLGEVNRQLEAQQQVMQRSHYDWFIYGVNNLLKNSSFLSSPILQAFEPYCEIVVIP